MFTFKQLAVFDAVARLGSVSLAASDLTMTQPAASMALQQLEVALGAQLFARSQRRLVLSEQGKALQPLARSMLIGVDEIAASINAKAVEGKLRVAASPTVADYLSDEPCFSFMLDHAGVRVSVTMLPAMEVITKVDEMAFDVGLVEFVTVRPTLDVIRWRNEALTVCCSPRHPLASRRNLLASGLDRQRWCLQHRLADTRRQFTLAMLKRLPAIDVVFESDSLHLLTEAVSADVGLGCLPRPCISRQLEQGTLSLTRRDGQQRSPWCKPLRETPASGHLQRTWKDVAATAGAAGSTLGDARCGSICPLPFAVVRTQPPHGSPLPYPSPQRRKKTGHTISDATR